MTLQRYGGLRFNEVFLLKWQDVKWDENKFYIHSPKTEHQGKSGRFSPLFREVRLELEKSWKEANLEESRDEWILHKKDIPNHRSQFLEIIDQAGLKPWERLFQNLRRTRSDEIRMIVNSSFLENSWLGHTESVASSHYFSPNQGV